MTQQVPTTPQPITSLGQLGAGAFGRGARALHLYDVPAVFGARQIGLVELTAEEELMAAKRAQNNALRLAYELAKEALRQIDGKPLSAGDGSIDVAWGAIGAKLRSLVIAAYNDIHTPAEVDVRDFLRSRQTQVG